MLFNRYFYILILSQNGQMGGRGSDRVVVEFTTTCAITTKVVNSNPIHDKVYLIQHYVIKFVSDLRQVISGYSVFRGIKHHKPTKQVRLPLLDLLLQYSFPYIL